MVHALHDPLLVLSHEQVHKLTDTDPDRLADLWQVFSKVSSALRDGPRLENLSWRMWYREAHVLPPEMGVTDLLAPSPTMLSLNNSPLVRSRAGSKAQLTTTPSSAFGSHARVKQRNRALWAETTAQQPPPIEFPCTSPQQSDLPTPTKTHPSTTHDQEFERNRRRPLSFQAVMESLDLCDNDKSVDHDRNDVFHELRRPLPDGRNRARTGSCVSWSPPVRRPQLASNRSASAVIQSSDSTPAASYQPMTQPEYDWQDKTEEEDGDRLVAAALANDVQVDSFPTLPVAPTPRQPSTSATPAMTQEAVDEWEEEEPVVQSRYRGKTQKGKASKKASKGKGGKTPKPDKARAVPSAPVTQQTAPSHPTPPAALTSSSSEQNQTTGTLPAPMADPADDTWEEDDPATIQAPTLKPPKVQKQQRPTPAAPSAPEPQSDTVPANVPDEEQEKEDAPPLRRGDDARYTNKPPSSSAHPPARAASESNSAGDEWEEEAPQHRKARVASRVTKGKKAPVRSKKTMESKHKPATDAVDKWEEDDAESSPAPSSTVPAPPTSEPQAAAPATTEQQPAPPDKSDASPEGDGWEEDVPITKQHTAPRKGKHPSAQYRSASHAPTLTTITPVTRTTQLTQPAQGTQDEWAEDSVGRPRTSKDEASKVPEPQQQVPSVSATPSNELTRGEARASLPTDSIRTILPVAPRLQKAASTHSVVAGSTPASPESRPEIKPDTPNKRTHSRSSSSHLRKSGLGGLTMTPAAPGRKSHTSLANAAPHNRKSATNLARIKSQLSMQPHHPHPARKPPQSKSKPVTFALGDDESASEVSDEDLDDEDVKSEHLAAAAAVPPEPESKSETPAQEDDGWSQDEKPATKLKSKKSRAKLHKGKGRASKTKGNQEDEEAWASDATTESVKRARRVAAYRAARKAREDDLFRKVPVTSLPRSKSAADVTEIAPKVQKDAPHLTGGLSSIFHAPHHETAPIVAPKTPNPKLSHQSASDLRSLLGAGLRMSKPARPAPSKDQQQQPEPPPSQEEAPKLKPSKSGLALPMLNVEKSQRSKRNLALDAEDQSASPPSPPLPQRGSIASSLPRIPLLHQLRSSSALPPLATQASGEQAEDSAADHSSRAVAMLENLATTSHVPPRRPQGQRAKSFAHFTEQNSDYPPDEDVAQWQAHLQLADKKKGKRASMPSPSGRPSTGRSPSAPAGPTDPAPLSASILRTQPPPLSPGLVQDGLCESVKKGLASDRSTRLGTDERRATADRSELLAPRRTMSDQVKQVGEPREPVRGETRDQARQPIREPPRDPSAPPPPPTPSQQPLRPRLMGPGLGSGLRPLTSVRQPRPPALLPPFTGLGPMTTLAGDNRRSQTILPGPQLRAAPRVPSVPHMAPYYPQPQQRPLPPPAAQSSSSSSESEDDVPIPARRSQSRSNLTDYHMGGW